MKGIPKSEILHVTETNKAGAVFYITSKESSKDCYFIYQQTQDGVVKLGKGKTPPELEKKYIYTKI